MYESVVLNTSFKQVITSSIERLLVVDINRNKLQHLEAILHTHQHSSR